MSTPIASKFLVVNAPVKPPNPHPNSRVIFTSFNDLIFSHQSIIICLEV